MIIKNFWKKCITENKYPEILEKTLQKDPPPVFFITGNYYLEM